MQSLLLQIKYKISLLKLGIKISKKKVAQCMSINQEISYLYLLEFEENDKTDVFG